MKFNLSKKTLFVACEMETIGKPVYHNSFPNLYGSWMREAYLDYNDCYWITLENCTSCLYEYANKTAFTYKSFTKLYDLKVPFIVRLSLKSFYFLLCLFIYVYYYYNLLKFCHRIMII